MPIRPKTRREANFLLEAMEIGEKVINDSNTLDGKIKVAFEAHIQYSKNIILCDLASNNLRSYTVKSIGSDFFIYWNEAVSEDVEVFWKELSNNKLDFQRKSPLHGLLNKGRLRQVDQWIGLINNFEALQQSGFLQKQFTISEIDQIKHLIDTEKKKRYELVNKCFQKKKIPFYQYLKFGESIAFLENCNLILKYFSESEREEIYVMWNTNE